MEPEKKRTRGNNYTSNEKTLLLNIAKKYHFIIHSKKLDHTTLHRKSAAWKKITDEFNAISIPSPNYPNNVDRTEESLRKFYGYIKKNKRNEEDNAMDKFAADGIIVHTNSDFNMGLDNSFEINTTKYPDEAKELLEKNINQIHKELDSIQTHSNKTRHRTSNYTVNERILLLKLIKEYQPIIDNKKNDSATTKRKSNAWAKIVEKFNDCSQHKIIRTEESLRKYYENIKKKVRNQEIDGLQDFDQKTVTFEDDIYNNLSVKSEEKSVAGSEYFDNGAVILEESYHSIELNSIDSDEDRNENCNYTVHEKILLLNLAKKYQQFIDEDTDQTVDAWNTITDQFNAMAFPNKFVRTADSLRTVYENLKNKSQTEEDNENTHESPIQEESAINNILRIRPFESDTNILEESIEFENVDDLNKKIEKTSSLVPAKNKKLTDLKIELYQLKNKSITLDNEIKHQQLLQERIKTRILELDLEKASEK